MNRRNFLCATAAALAAPSLSLSQEKRRPRIVLRSSWQTVNIGDIGHTPGVLTLLDGRDWSLGVKSLENCVLAEREVAPQTWTRLLESHA